MRRKPAVPTRFSLPETRHIAGRVVRACNSGSEGTNVSDHSLSNRLQTCHGAGFETFGVHAWRCGLTGLWMQKPASRCALQVMDVGSTRPTLNLCTMQKLSDAC